MSLPERISLVEDVQGSRTCGVFTDHQGQEDLKRHHRHGQQHQLLLGNSGLHQLQARHRVGSRETNLEHTHGGCWCVWLSAAGGHQPRSFTLAVRSRIQKVKTVGIFTMEKSSLYVSHTSFVSSTSFFFPLLGSRSLLKRPTSVVEIKKTIPQKNKKSGGNNRKRECHL